MLRIKSASAMIAAAVMLGMSGAAMAADMPVKAVKAPVAEPLDIHGYADLTFANGRVTPGGTVVYPGNRGFLTQAEIGLSIDLYKNPNGFFNKVTAFGGVWNEWWSRPPVGGRAWQEMDYWLGASVTFAQNWTLSASYLVFQIPNGPSAQNWTGTLSYADSGFGILPFSINPYVTLLYQTGNFNLVPTGGTGVYRVQLGITPTIPLAKATGLPLTLTIPTWVTFAEKKYWSTGLPASNLCGPLTTSPCSNSSLGVFSTGLQAKYMLTSIPARFGSWYIKAGVQYYHLFNDSLLASQTLLNGIATSFPNAKRDFAVVSTGIGFSF